MPRYSGALAAVLLAMSRVAAPATLAQPAIPTLPTMKTEEGQTVIYDRYTWQRRELDKRLP